jgi:hypothetical protein
MFSFLGFQIRECPQNFSAPDHSRFLQPRFENTCSSTTYTFTTQCRQTDRHNSPNSNKRKTRTKSNKAMLLVSLQDDPLCTFKVTSWEHRQRLTSCVMATMAGWTTSAGNGRMQHSVTEGRPTLAVSIYTYLYHGSYKTTACKHARSPPHTKRTTFHVPLTSCT